MTTFRVHIAFPADSALPRDEMQITPHFSGDNAQALANALKANLIAQPIIATKPFKIRVYDATKAPPSYPLAFAEQTGTPVTTSIPRELAICLSYYATVNRPRYRGRLYLPAFMFGTSASLRPTSGQRATALGFAAVFDQNLPSGHNWVVWSKVAQQQNGVSNWWVDDEWDVVRSRGLRSTTRDVGAREGGAPELAA